MKKIKQLTEADYEEVLALHQYAFHFQHPFTDEEKEQFKKKIAYHKVFGWIEGNKLAAKLHIIPSKIYIQNELFEMGGIASVASWPEQRRGGKVKHLLYEALQTMKKEGKTLSYLYPFSVSFYRKYGWELAFDNLECHIPIKQFQNEWATTGTISRLSKSKETISLLNKVYTAYAKSFNGALYRSDYWWNILLNSKDQIAIVNEQNPEGYIVYEMKNNIFHVKDAAFSTLNGRKLIMSFIGNHDSMVASVQWKTAVNDPLPLFIEEPQFEQKIVPYFMVRIVDVMEFLRQYPFINTEHQTKLTLALQDDFFPENTGKYSLSQALTEKAASNEPADIVMDIQRLVQILLGYKSTQELWEANLIEGKFESVQLLETIIPKSQTFFPNYF